MRLNIIENKTEHMLATLSTGHQLKGYKVQ